MDAIDFVEKHCRFFSDDRSDEEEKSKQITGPKEPLSEAEQ